MILGKRQRREVAERVLEAKKHIDYIKIFLISVNSNRDLPNDELANAITWTDDALIALNNVEDSLDG